MKKYYGVLIALLPFITGTYKSLGNWSSSEAFGYNIFNLALIGFGIYYLVKHWSRKVETLDLSHYDIAVFKASAYVDELSKDTQENETVKRVAINEITKFIELFREKRGKKWKSQKEIDEVTQSLNEFVEGNKETLKAARGINI